jgi:hypothetical protein
VSRQYIGEGPGLRVRLFFYDINGVLPLCLDSLLNHPRREKDKVLEEISLEPTASNASAISLYSTRDKSSIVLALGLPSTCTSTPTSISNGVRFVLRPASKVNNASVLAKSGVCEEP